MATPSVPVPNRIEGVVDQTPRTPFEGTYLEVIHDWVVTVDHKKIGLMYIGYALIFLVVAGD